MPFSCKHPGFYIFVIEGEIQCLYTVTFWKKLINWLITQVDTQINWLVTQVDTQLNTVSHPTLVVSVFVMFVRISIQIV